MKLVSGLQIQLMVGALNPGELANKMLGDVKSWLLLVATAYAVIQFIMAMFDYMSKDMQKQSQGKDHAFRACVGLVGAFSAATIMAYIQLQTQTWSSVRALIDVFLS